MYLVRSVEIQHLSEKDLRHTLLSHFNQPLVRTRKKPNDSWTDVIRV